jgi:hypothetical protein
MTESTAADLWGVWCEHPDGRRYWMGDSPQTRWTRADAERIAHYLSDPERGRVDGVFEARALPTPTEPANVDSSDPQRHLAAARAWLDSQTESASWRVTWTKDYQDPPTTTLHAYDQIPGIAPDWRGGNGSISLCGGSRRTCPPMDTFSVVSGAREVVLANRCATCARIEAEPLAKAFAAHESAMTLAIVAWLDEDGPRYDYRTDGDNGPSSCADGQMLDVYTRWLARQIAKRWGHTPALQRFAETEPSE